MSVLVTGGGGFLGSAIVHRMVQRGASVRSLSRGRYPELEKLGVTCIQGDIADGAAVEAASVACDLIFHVAARAGVAGRARDYYQANVVGTRNVLAACRKHGITRLVHTSSPSVVFDGTDMEGVNESVPYPAHFEAAYPATKAEAEQLVLAANGPELATVALRPHLIWGPGDNHLVPRILARGKAGKLRRIGGTNKRIDSTYIDDAADAHVLAADRLAPGSPIAGKVYFISGGEPIPLWDLVNRILAADGQPPVMRSIPAWLAHALAWVMENGYGVLWPDAEPPLTRFVVRELATAHWFDLSAARRDLGYEPRISVEVGLQRLGKWLRDLSAAIQT